MNRGSSLLCPARYSAIAQCRALCCGSCGKKVVVELCCGIVRSPPSKRQYSRWARREMRGMAEVLLDRPDDNQFFDEAEVVKFLGAEKEVISPCSQALAELLDTPLTAGTLRGVTSLQWVGVLDKSPKPSDARNAFALWLGTPTAPAEGLSQAAGVILPSASDLQELDGDDAKKKLKKGGGMTDKAERMRQAWPSLLESMYYPPAAFDPHMKGSPTRDLKVLKKLVVQEVIHASTPLHAAPPSLTSIAHRDTHHARIIRP